MKTKDARALFDALVAIKELDLPIDTAYQLARLGTKLELELKAYEEMRQKLIGKYGAHDKDGQLVTNNDRVSIENPTEFAAEMEKIMETELDLEVPQLPLSAFKDKDGEMRMSTTVMAGLLPLIKEQE